MELSRQYPGKRAVITGGASGIGKGIALQLAADGWKVAIADINRHRMEETASEVRQRGGEPMILYLDVRSEGENDAAARTLQEAWGGVDVVFLNAGIASFGEFTDLTLADWSRCLDIDLWGVIFGLRSFIPVLKEQKWGHIVMTSSFAGMVTSPQMAAYNVAKAGVIALAETLHKELSTHGIHVAVVCPAAVKTNLPESFENSTSAVGRSIAKALEEATMDGEEAARLILRKVEARRLYIVFQNDVHVLWSMKRLMPELFNSLIRWMYRRRMWLFAGAD